MERETEREKESERERERERPLFYYNPKKNLFTTPLKPDSDNILAKKNKNNTTLSC